MTRIIEIQRIGYCVGETQRAVLNLDDVSFAGYELLDEVDGVNNWYELTVILKSNNQSITFTVFKGEADRIMDLLLGEEDECTGMGDCTCMMETIDE